MSNYIQKKYKRKPRKNYFKSARGFKLFGGGRRKKFFGLF